MITLTRRFMRINFVKWKKELTERTYIRIGIRIKSSIKFEFKRSSLTKIDIILSKMLVQHVGCARKRIQHHPTWKKLKKCWINAWTYLNLHQKFFTKNIIHHSPPTHPIFFIQHVWWCWINMLDSFSLALNQRKCRRKK